MLVTPETGDDAAVYQLPGSGPDAPALIQTVDFFTPIVDDPYDWGRIAAANALSDVYAMGGWPIMALNLVAWPIQALPLEVLARVLEGGASVVREAGAVIVGGHSIHDPEPKYGMAVTGLVDPSRIVRNSTMRPGDVLVLTKPLGTGIISTAVKAGRASEEQIRLAVDTMARLNRAAAEAMLEVGVSAATDVTGFGLLGHLLIALRAAGVSAEIEAGAVPFLPGVLGLARAGVVPSGTHSNRDFAAPNVDWGELDEAQQLALADAQTSGGLLMAVPEARSEALRRALEARGVDDAVIGRTVAVGDEPGRISVRGTLA